MQIVPCCFRISPYSQIIGWRRNLGSNAVWTDCINLLEANIEAVRVEERFFNIGHLDEVIAGHESVVSGNSLAGSDLRSMWNTTFLLCRWLRGEISSSDCLKSGLIIVNQTLGCLTAAHIWLGSKPYPHIIRNFFRDKPGNTKGGSITVLLTSYLTGLESKVWQWFGIKSVTMGLYHPSDVFTNLKYKLSPISQISEKGISF
jgi:hypothetical protein